MKAYLRLNVGKEVLKRGSSESGALFIIQALLQMNVHTRQAHHSSKDAAHSSVQALINKCLQRG